MDDGSVSILGVRIDAVSRDHALKKVGDFLHGEGSHMIFTPNPEMLVDAQYDVYFREVLNTGDLNICDGVGIALVSGGRLTRVPGADFMTDICALAQEEGASIFILGGADPQGAAEALGKQFPRLQVAGTAPGPKIKQKTQGGRLVLDMDEQENRELLARIALSAPDIIFVGFGHSKQEKWIYESLGRMPSVKVAMAVGGSIDFLSGAVRRAPMFIRRAGVEWLYRLALEPWRLKRIWKATGRFLYTYYGQKNS